MATPSPAPREIKKLLVANRSEIAIRVFRAANELGIRTVAIYAQEDRFSMHRFKADESYQLNPDKGPLGAYLDIEGIVALAKEKGVDAIHPGYGFLSENADFARACRDNGIQFVGPRPEVLDGMGDKVAARALAKKANVATLPGTEDPVADPEEALKAAEEIGFPLIIKAAAGGGGRGMRVVHEPDALAELLNEAQTEALNAFGDASVFLERFVGRARHIEVQLLGDQHGNRVHLFERDCSVQRRHQKVIEIAPAPNLSEKVRKELCEASLRLGDQTGYDNAGTVEFLVDADTDEWFFIEMNPRIQVEHTVTEEVTGLDLVRSQILIAAGHPLDSDHVGIPSQSQISVRGFAVQCRITTEDPEKGFAPDTGKIITYRSGSGAGVRLDGGLASAGSMITPFYDSMLVKVTSRAQTFEMALKRTDRALREFRIRGVKTNIPFLENVIANDIFRSGLATTRLIDTTPELFEFTPRRDRATKLLNYIADISVNGNPHAKGATITEPFTDPVPVEYDHAADIQPGTRQKLQELGPEGFAKWILEQDRLLLTDTTFRDAHQSLLATRVRTYDMLGVARAVAHRAPELFSLEMWGGATFDSSMRFLKEDPFERLRLLREAVPNICFQMLYRGSNAVGYSNYPDNVIKGFVRHSAEAGMDIFRIFDSLNYTPNLEGSMKAVREETNSICEATLCYTGDILDPKRDKYTLRYYVDLAKELEKMGAHMLCIKDMAGLCRPFAARKLVETLKQEVGLPVHFHTHDTSGINASSILSAAEAGVDVADAALSSLSGSTSQPNLNSIAAALENSPRETGLKIDTLDRFSTYWEYVRKYYFPFDTSEPHGTAEVYLHEMPGGQYTNLKEQATSMGLGEEWPAVARTYAEVNQLFGDIVKVTPSSKVVGDMALFLYTRGIKPADVVNLPPNTPFPESVIDMLAGGLGQPLGGWPADVQKVVVGDQRPITTERPGANAEPVDLDATRNELAQKLNRPTDQVTDDELYSYLMYPQVFIEFAEHKEEFGNVAVLPTTAFFYGMLKDQEIAAEIDPGKTLFIKLLQVTDANEEGVRTAIFELNGVARHVEVTDRDLGIEKVSRPKADESNPNEVGAPMPGVVAEITVTPGTKVEEGDPLLTLEAMKMFTTIGAPAAGTVEAIEVAKGDNVDAGDLLAKIVPAE